MSNILKIHVEIDDDAISAKIGEIINDELMLQIHQLLAVMCDPYVPMDEGVLSQSVEVTPEYLRYNTPYAHYQYVGMAYGPSIPIIENGIVVGWWSPPGQQKYPTGNPLSYNTSMHPLATKEWDRAMMRDRRDEFVEQVNKLVRRRVKDLYG